jgi:predicted RNA-binding Zn ribbon-like protein
MTNRSYANTGYEGGAPILGEGLALDLMNTYHAVRGKPADGIASPDDATAWTLQLADRLRAAGAPAVDDARLLDADADALRALRSAVRGIASAVVAAQRPADNDVDAVNRLAALSPRWTSIAWAADGATTTTQAAGEPTSQVLGALASDAINLFSGADAERLRLCNRPGCVLFFLKDHPRREWCTPACGARVRAARAYEKHRSHREPATTPPNL